MSTHPPAKKCFKGRSPLKTSGGGVPPLVGVALRGGWVGISNIALANQDICSYVKSFIELSASFDSSNLSGK